MGLLTNRVEKSEIKPGDHIYTYRAVFAYSHHGIFVGGSKVVHFTRVEAPSDAASEISDLSSSCPTFPDCGFRLPDSGVVLSCLDCFLRNGSLYSFEYGVSPSVFFTKVRGGTCTTAASDPTEMVIHRAMYLLQNGFGDYDVFQNNCEDFALYCKTGLLTVDRLGVGSSGQASSVVGAPLAALLSSPLKLLIPSPVGVATVTAGMYCMSRYATDIGVRTDVVKVAVEDLAENLGCRSSSEKSTVEQRLLIRKLLGDIFLILYGFTMNSVCNILAICCLLMSSSVYDYSSIQTIVQKDLNFLHIMNCLATREAVIEETPPRGGYRNFGGCVHLCFKSEKPTQ